jgi:hypothetical protein
MDFLDEFPEPLRERVVRRRHVTHRARRIVGIHDHDGHGSVWCRLMPDGFSSYALGTASRNICVMVGSWGCHLLDRLAIQSFLAGDDGHRERERCHEDHTSFHRPATWG